MWLSLNRMAGNVAVDAELGGAMLITPCDNSHLIRDNIIVHCSRRPHTMAAASMKGFFFYGIAKNQNNLPMTRSRCTYFICDSSYCAVPKRHAMQSQLFQLFRPAYIDQFFEASDHVIHVNQVFMGVPLVISCNLCSQRIILFLT